MSNIRMFHCADNDQNSCNMAHATCDPTIWQPGFDLPQQQWSLLNRFRTEQGHCGARRRKWRLTDTDLCPCCETQTMSHIVESCQHPEWCQPVRQEFMENECEALPGVAYPGVRDNRSTINTKTGYDDMMMSPDKTEWWLISATLCG